MLSLGIRFGQGFDRDTIRKFIDSRRETYEYDVLILGTNAGGLVCAKESTRYGKKTAVVFWKIPTPSEEEGYDEDLNQAARALNLNEISIREYIKKILEEENKSELAAAVVLPHLRKSRVTYTDSKSENDFFMKRKWQRKVRKSKIDLKNAITNMADEGRKYMHELAVKQDLQNAKLHRKQPIKLSWGRMMEMVLDHIINMNWTMLTDNIRDRIHIFNGYPLLIDEHKVNITLSDGDVKEITAETIISAVEVHNSFPDSVAGSREFGVNCDDFFRLSSSPGKTLIVGAEASGLECAGILTSFDFPVTVVYRTEMMKEYDREIVSMIRDDLIHRGVTFLGKTTLLEIVRNNTGDRLVAEFCQTEDDTSSNSQWKRTFDDEFDTVLFTTKEKINCELQQKSILQIESERLLGKTYTPEEETMFRNFLVIDDIPGNRAATEMNGMYTAKALFRQVEPSQADTSEGSCNTHVPRNSDPDWIPNLILTPVEYAYVGTTLEAAVTRIGKSCIDVFAGYIETAEIISEEESPKDTICFVKGIIYKKKEIILGLHFVGADAFLIISKVLDELKNGYTVSHLPNSIRNLYQSLQEEDGEIIEE